MLVFFDDERRFADDDLELARNLAGAARGALERSELFEAERRSRALAQHLARTGTLLATELDPAAVLDEVVAPCSVAARGRRGGHPPARGRRARGRARRRATTPMGVLGSRVPSTARLAGDVVQSRSPVAVDNARDDPRSPSPIRSSPRLCGVSRRAAGRAAKARVQGVLSVFSARASHLAGGGGAGALGARGQRLRRAGECRAVPARRAGEGAQCRDPRQHRRRHRRRRPRRRVVLWNPAAERITGVPAPEATRPDAARYCNAS